MSRNHKVTGESRERVAEMIAKKPGITVRDIAKALDISTQRVYQLTAALGLKYAITGKWVSNGKGAGNGSKTG